MGYGFQCFDATTGALILDVSDRLTRILGIVNEAGNVGITGSITIPDADMAGGTLFYFIYSNTRLRTLSLTTDTEKVSVSNNVLTYENLSRPLIYGVY